MYAEYVRIAVGLVESMGSQKTPIGNKRLRKAEVKPRLESDLIGGPEDLRNDRSDASPACMPGDYILHLHGSYCNCCRLMLRS